MEPLVLSLRRTLPGSRTAVYTALTDPELLAKWWGPRGFIAPDVDFNPRIGRTYRIAMQPPEGELFHLTGAFQEVEPPCRLAYTFRWEPPDADDRDTLVRIVLEDRGEGTEAVLAQGTFATEGRLTLHQQGWADSLDRLEQLLEHGRDGRYRFS